MKALHSVVIICMVSGYPTAAPHNNSLQESRVGKLNPPMTDSVCDLVNRFRAASNRMDFKIDSNAGKC